MCEKAWSTNRVTMHWRPEICQLGMQFVQNWLRAFGILVDGSVVYNFGIQCFGYLSSKIWRKHSLTGLLEIDSLECGVLGHWPPDASAHAARARRDSPWARTPRLASARRSARGGILSRQPTFRSSPLAPRASRARAGCTDRAARPMAMPPYHGHATAHTATP
jgi:hypothetical protein